MTVDLVIRGGTVMSPHGRLEGGVAIDMLTLVNRGRLTLGRCVEIASANPARAWGLYPRKGALAAGADGDITLVDMARQGQIRGAALYSESKMTPFEETRVTGLPVCTIVRGRMVMRDGEFVGEPGWGKTASPATTPVCA